MRILLCLALVPVLFFGAGRYARAQEAMPSVNETVSSDEAAEEAEPQAKERFFIEVSDGLLSVELKDAEFGKALGEVARQAGFGLELTAEVNSKKLSTSFKDIELEKGILRLLTLIREKNYSIHYGEGGTISKIEVLGTGTTAPSAIGRGTASPPAQQPPGAFPMRRTFPSSRTTERYRSPYAPAPERQAPRPPAKTPAIIEQSPAGNGTTHPAPPMPLPPADITEIEDMMDEPFKEGSASVTNGMENAPEKQDAPFIPPKEEPVYIPPQGGPAPGGSPSTNK